VGASAVVAAQPLDQHARRQHHDDDPHGALGADLQPARQLRLQQDQRQPDREQRSTVADAPPRSDPGRAAGVPFVRGDQRRDRDEMVGIGRVPQAEQERHGERDGERRPVEQGAQPGVDVLDGLVQGLEVHRDLLGRVGVG
jgi:hypothetical protein